MPAITDVFMLYVLSPPSSLLPQSFLFSIVFEASTISFSWQGVRWVLLAFLHHVASVGYASLSYLYKYVAHWCQRNMRPIGVKEL